MANAPQPVRRGRPLVPTPTPLPTAGGPGTPPAKPVPHAPGAPRRAGLPAASPARPPAGAAPGGAAAGPPLDTATTVQQRGRDGADGAEPDATNCGAVAWMAACRHLARDATGLRQYRPTDRTALASAVAAVTMGPVAAWPAQLLPHVPCRDTQPRRPAATHARTAPLTAEQLYVVAGALLADGGESFVHHHGPARIAVSIQGPQRDAPDPWHATLRGRTRVWDAGDGTPPPGPQQGEALVLQTAGYQAILHGHAGGYRSHVLAGGRWTVWHSTTRQGAFPPLPHVDWQQGPTQAYYMSADPWPLAVLLHTVSAPNKRQEPGCVNPPALVWSPDQEEHLRAAWQGDAIRATDVPDLHAGPITHARPAATLAVAQRGQQNPQWVVCMFSPADAHIVVCHRLRPRAPARARSRDPRGRLYPHDRQGATGGRTPRPPAPGQTEGQRPGGEAGGVASSGAPRRPRAPAGGPDHSVPLATSLPRPAVEGQTRPPNRLHTLANVAASGRAARCHPGSRARARDTSPRCGGPGPHAGATHGPTGQSALRTSSGGRHPEVGAAPPGARGHGADEMPPVCGQVLHKQGQCCSTWRGTRCTLRPRWTTRRRPPTSCKGGHGGPHGTPRTPGAPRPRRPTTQTAMRRHPGQPRCPAVRANQGPSPRGWPPWPPWLPRPPGPPCGRPRWERAQRMRRTRMLWLRRRTQRRCRYGIADSRRTRRATPCGSSRGTCATASYHQTGPSGTRSGGAGGRRPVPTRSTSSPACYPRRGALPSCSRKQGSPPGRKRCTWPRRSGTRGTPPSSAAGWRRREPPPPREGGGLLTAVSSKYVAEHEVLSFTEIVPGKAAALEIRTDGGGLTLINVHGPQAGCSPWAGRAAFWADIQMYATARSLGGRHPVVIAGDTNIYMDATTNPATEHFRAGWEACGFRRATAGGEEDMTPTLHPSRHRVDTFLVNEPLLPWSLRESVWARGMAHPQVVGSDHLPVRLALPGLLSAAGRAAMPTPYSHTEGRLLPYDARPRPSNTACGRRSPPRRMNPPWRPGWVPQSSTTTGPCPRPRWIRCSNTSTRRTTPWRVWWDAGSRPRRGRTRRRGTSQRAECGSRRRSSAMTPWQRARRQRTRRTRHGMASGPRRRFGSRRSCGVCRPGSARPHRASYRRS